MNVRDGVLEDVPAIVELLKMSLGESLIPKSASLWQWKHIQNPFGASPVLVAEDEEKIVGVRAFMNWTWVYKGEILNAVRAVDTATHPDYQGKGIFKKLTLQGVAKAKNAGIDFVFNTPNMSSKPGYLKMGWAEKGRVPLKLKINPFAYKRSLAPVAKVQDWDQLIGFLSKVKSPCYDTNKVQTLINSDYVSWRYKNNPLFDYSFISDYHSYVLFYRIKEHKFGHEMRVVDLFINESTFNQESRRGLQKVFRDTSSNSFLTSVSGRQYLLGVNKYLNMGLLPILKKGPIVTLRNVNMNDEQFHELLNVNSWAYSLGDMELF